MPLIDPVTMSTAMGKGKRDRIVPKTVDNAAQPKPSRPHPIEVHTTPASRAVQHIIPALLAGLFVSAFHSLVSDPILAMEVALPMVAILQTVYMMTCLPVAGAQRTARRPRPGEKRKAGDGGSNHLSARCRLAGLQEPSPTWHIY
jgi:hypothetical protein